MKKRNLVLVGIISSLAVGLVILRARVAHHNTYVSGGLDRFYNGKLAERAESREDGATGLLHGRVVDENNQPVYVMGVVLLPAEKLHATGDERFWALTKDWTNRQGEYRFSGLPPGEYYLSVGTEGAPSGERPFAPIYYPGTDRAQFSEPVRVQASLDIELRQLRLRRIPIETIKVHVRWHDGERVSRSNLLFHNLSFPNQAVIGGEAPQIDDGEGEFAVPTGFTYYASAVVHCDAGAQIQSVESRPVQTIRVDVKHTPREITFVIPVEQCRLWHPKPANAGSASLEEAIP